MSAPDPNEVSSELRDILEAERERPGLDAQRIERIRAAAAARFALEEAASTPDAPGSGSDRGVAAQPGPPLSPLAAGIVGMITGVVLGALSHAAWVDWRAPHEAPAPSRTEPQTDDEPAGPPVVPPSMPADPLDGPRTTSVPEVTQVVVPAAEPRAATGARVQQPVSDADRGGRGLAAERRLIDSARAALAAGRSDAALDSLETHSQRHPSGSLREEREALRVEALGMAGRAAEATAAAAAFDREFPDSLYAARVHEALPRE